MIGALAECLFIVQCNQYNVSYFFVSFKMLVANKISNNTSVIHLVESGSDHGNSMEDTLEAEISKLETTINDVEADNDLPDVDMCPSDLEEGEILDSFLYEEKQSETSRTFERNLVDNDGSDNDKYIICDVFNNAGKGILEPEEKSHNIEYNNGDEHTVLSELNETYVVPNNIVKIVKHEKDSKPNYISYLTNSSEPKTLQITDSTHSPEPDTASYKNCSRESQKTEGRHETGIPVKPELEISNENKFNCTKSVIISNNCEAVSLKRCDFELSTNDITVHLNSYVASTRTPHRDTNDERNEANSHKKSDCGVTKSSLLVGVDDDVVRESGPESYSQLDAKGFEDALLYDEDDDNVPCSFARIKDNGPVDSSTPLKIKADTLKRWKPTFLSPNTESFLILDEFEEFTGHEQSICSCINSSMQSKSIQEAGATHSTKHRSLTCNSLLFKINEDSNIADMKESRNNDNEHTEAAFDEAGDIKIVLQLNDNGLQVSSLFAKQSPLLANATPVQSHGIQDIFLPVTEDRNMGTVNWETTGSEPSNLPSESMNQNSLEQKQIITSRSSDDYISNNPQENFDNNNPEWELLRKLETDEERYRAVRQRWRNLTIPDPNQDLTCRNWRIRQDAVKVTVSAVSTNSDAAPDQTSANGNDVPSSIQGHHKRSLSDQQASTMSQPIVKRPRTQSCTTVFDVKLEQLRRNIHYEKQRIYNQEQLALRQLSMKQIMERYCLRKHYHVRGIDGQMLQLYYQQQGVGNCDCIAILVYLQYISFKLKVTVFF